MFPFFRTALILALLTSPPTLIAGIPTLGDPTLNYFSQKEEEQMGLSFYRSLRANLSFINDIEINHYLNSVASRLVSHSNANQKKFKFFIIKAPSINAFAGPDAYVGIHSELLLQAQNESQFASVLAHEIAHVTQKHLARTFSKASTSTSLTLAALVAAILVGTKDPQAGQAILLSGIAGAQQTSINFIRSNESEADRIGINTLTQANINPHGSVEFFEILQNQSNQVLYGTEYLRSHPLTSARIADAKNHLTHASANLPADSLDFQLARARLAVLLHRLPHTYFQKNYTSKSPQITKDVHQYQQALRLIQNKKTTAARKILGALLKHNQHPWIVLALAKTYTLEHQDQRALNLLSALAKSYPDYLPVSLALVNALNNKKQYHKSLTLLKNLQHTNDNAIIYQTLAKTYFANGQIAAALEATGDQYVREGYLELAIGQYDHALKQQNVSDSTKKRLETAKTKLTKIKEETNN